LLKKDWSRRASLGQRSTEARYITCMFAIARKQRAIMYRDSLRFVCFVRTPNEMALYSWYFNSAATLRYGVVVTIWFQKTLPNR
jgi:hypothetical protein